MDKEILDNKEDSGVFEGNLSEDEFTQLINILKTSNLEKWYFPEKKGHDGAVTTLIIYYNGKRKYFKSMFPPTISHQLIDFLNHLDDKKLNLIRTEKYRNLEY